MRTSKIVLAASIALACAFVGLLALLAVGVAARNWGTDLPLGPWAGSHILIIIVPYLMHSAWFVRPVSKNGIFGRLLMSALALPYAAFSFVLVCEFYVGEEELRQAGRSKAAAEALETRDENRRLIDERTRHLVELRSKLDHERSTKARQNLELKISLAELELLTPLPELPPPGIDITNELAKLWGTTPSRYVFYDALATGVVLVVSPYVLLSWAAWMWARQSEARDEQSSANHGATRIEIQRVWPESASSTTITSERLLPTKQSSGASSLARASGSSTTSRRKRKSRQVENSNRDREASQQHREASISAISQPPPRRKSRITTTVGPNDLQPASIPMQSTTLRTERLRALTAEPDQDCGRSRFRKLASSRNTETSNLTCNRTAVWIFATGTAGFLDCIGYWSRGPPIL